MAYDAAIMVGLVSAWYLYATNWAPIAPLLQNPGIRVGFHAVWFAILGGVAISFKGVAEHWNPKEWPRGRWALWYVSRPFNGIIVGAVVYFALQLANTSSAPSMATTSVVAFVLGTQERRFYTFVRALANVFLTVPGDATAFTLADISPSKGPAGTTVIVNGYGLLKGTEVTVGGAALLEAQTSRDGTVVAGQIPPGSGQADVTVTLPSGLARTLKHGFTYE